PGSERKRLPGAVARARTGGPAGRNDPSLWGLRSAERHAKPKSSAAEDRARVPRDAGGPPVVLLACGSAFDLVDDADGARDLEPGEMLAAVVAQLRVAGLPVSSQRDDGADPLAEPLVGGGDHDGVGDIRVGFEDGLHLFGVDLLPA